MANRKDLVTQMFTDTWKATGKNTLPARIEDVATGPHSQWPRVGSGANDGFAIGGGTIHGGAPATGHTVGPHSQWPRKPHPDRAKVKREGGAIPMGSGGVAPTPPAGAGAGSEWGGYTKPGNMLTAALDRGGMLGMGAMMAVGGGASYATGGEFWQGAVAGGMAGYGARGIHRHMTSNFGGRGSSFFGEGGKLANIAGDESAGGMKRWAAGMMNDYGAGVQTIQARHAMLAGAGLFGMMGGGSRKNNHRRGMNAHRGNTF